MTVFPGLVAMKPNTAVCLCLGGLSLLLLAQPRPDPRKRRASALLAGAMALVGALTLVEYLTEWRFGIDELLFQDRYVSRAPGRMAPITAFNFVCLGTALWLLRFPHRTVIAHTLAIGTACTSILAMVGYLYGVPSLYESGRFSAIALHTSVAFLLLSVGVWCAGSRVGFMRVLTNSETSGMLVRRYLPAALIVPFLIGWLRVQGVRYGWFDPELGVVIVAMTNATAFVVLVWIGAHSVHVSEGRQALARQELRESEGRLRQLADAMPQIVWTSRPDGMLDYSNRRWYEYIEQTETEVSPADWHLRVHPDDLAGAAAAWGRATGSGEPYATEFRVRRADGAYRWFLVRALPIREADGTISRWYGTCTDIHEHRQLQEQNEQLLGSERAARSEAERTSQMKDEFLSTLSHELRTPLNAILGWAQMLRGDPANSGDVESGLATIERNARAQKGIIEDLLDMSAIVSGKVRLDVQRMDLVSVVEAAVETVRPAATAKGIRLQPVLDPKSRHVSGDPNRLQQVFWNLLTNAVKFTPKGGSVQVVLERIHSHLEVSVADSGEGIAPEFLPHVFDRFRQQDASTTRRHGGLGLGLAIVKQIVELHGGTVHVGSPGLGQGTTFRVMLPLNATRPEASHRDEDRCHPQAETTPPSSDLVDGFRLAGVRVLVVDDDADARALVKRLLEDRGANVQAAGSAGAAVELFRAGRPDVLVSDIGMPGEDGYSLLRRVRALEAEVGGTPVPAVALTAYARSEDRMKAVLAGFQMHVAKPVEPAELLAMVASLAGRAG